MHKSKLRMGYMTFRGVLIIPCDMLLRVHLSSTSIISLLGSGRVEVDGRRDIILQLW